MSGKDIEQTFEHPSGIRRGLAGGGYYEHLFVLGGDFGGCDGVP
jgi:hypothetical protein